MNTNKALEQALLMQSENSIFHAAYQKEISFYRAVQSGNLEDVKLLFTPLSATGLGNLSKNPVKNMRYHFIVSVALITRFCIEGTMPTETAYTLSDLYIRNADAANSVEALAKLHQDMVLDFTTRMHQLDKDAANSMLVLHAIDFIHKNLRKPIKEKEIADHLQVNSSYLSTQFKQEIGVGIKLYIQQLRVEAAKNMLKYSDYSFSDISNYLCFTSHSYFIKIFKSYVHMTPKEYRDRYFQSNWTEHSL